MSWVDICNDWFNSIKDRDDLFPRVKNMTFKDEKMTNPLPETVQQIAKEFIQILDKYYPDIVKRKYDSHGYPDREGCPALDRAEMCIYIELMKAGAFNDQI